MPEIEPTVIIGRETHADPTTQIALYHAVKNCHEQKIPAIVCQEAPFNSSLEEEYQKACRNLETLSKIIAQHSLQEFFYLDDKLVPYIAETRQNDLLDKLKSAIPDPVLNNHFARLESLTILLADQAKKILLGYLKQNNLPYVPIDGTDTPQLVEEAYTHASRNEDYLRFINKYEASRIATMSHHVIEKGIKPLEATGGIVFCNVGSLHKLGDAIRAKYARSIAIEEVYCYSDCYTLRAKEIAETEPKARTLHFQNKGRRFNINPEFKRIVDAHMDKALLKTAPKRSMHSYIRPEPDYRKLLQSCPKRTMYTGALALFGLLGASKLLAPGQEDTHQPSAATCFP